HLLLDVIGRHRFEGVNDWLALLPNDLPRPFTNRELAAALGCRQNQAQKITNTLRKAGGIERVGKEGNAWLYSKL
ncbi:MAG: hypothetical protein P8183_19900, partial [Anaerolineae bacterium]